MKKYLLPITAALLLAGLLASLAIDAEEPLLSWSVLARVQVKPGLLGDIETTFDPAIKALDQQPVKLAGFMFPVQAGSQVQRFILSAKEPTCATCLPGSADAMVLVSSSKPVQVTTERIQVKGTFKLVSEMGLLYHMDQAAVNSH